MGFDGPTVLMSALAVEEQPRYALMRMPYFVADQMKAQDFGSMKKLLTDVTPGAHTFSFYGNLLTLSQIPIAPISRPLSSLGAKVEGSTGKTKCVPVV